MASASAGASTASTGDGGAKPAPFRVRRGATYFASGVMGGNGAGASSEIGVRMEPQDYRPRLVAALLDADPTATVIDPLELGKRRARELFADGEEPWQRNADVRRMLDEVVAAAAAADVVVSYLPVASMGSALELEAASRAGKAVIAVAPGAMRGNWVVRAHATVVVETIDDAVGVVRAALADCLPA